MKIAFKDTHGNTLYKHIGPLTISESVTSDSEAPLVKSLQHSPLNPTNRTRVAIMSYIDEGLSGVDPFYTTIVYRVNDGNWTTAPYFSSIFIHPPAIGEEGVLNLTYSAGDTFEYYINGSDAAGNYFESDVQSYTVNEIPTDTTWAIADDDDVHADRTTASLNYGVIVWLNASDPDSGINNVTIFYRSDLLSNNWANKTVYRPVDENYFRLELLPADLQEIGIVNDTLQYRIKVANGAGLVTRLTNNNNNFTVSLSSEFDLEAPLISASHGEVNSDEPVTITAAIEEIGLADVEIGIINYRTSTRDNYTRMPIFSAASNPWEFPRTATVDIPTQDPGTTVYYYVEGTDSEGNRGTSDEQSYKYPGGDENELFGIKLIYWGIAGVAVALTIATLIMLGKKKK